MEKIIEIPTFQQLIEVVDTYFEREKKEVTVSFSYNNSIINILNISDKILVKQELVDAEKLQNDTFLGNLLNQVLNENHEFFIKQAKQIYWIYSHKA